MGPLFPDFAPGRYLWVRGVSMAKFDYARAYGACKICLKSGHDAIRCPEMRNMKFDEDYVFYTPINAQGQQRH